MTLTEAFSGRPDTRKGSAVKYVLSEIMIMAICAILCGANNWIETTDWYKDRQKWLKERFGFTHVPPLSRYVSRSTVVQSVVQSSSSSAFST